MLGKMRCLKHRIYSKAVENAEKMHYFQIRARDSTLILYRKIKRVGIRSYCDVASESAIEIHKFLPAYLFLLTIEFEYIARKKIGNFD